MMISRIKYTQYGLRFPNRFLGQIWKILKTAPFRLQRRITLNNALFAKIRQICTSLKARQWSLNRGEFCHIVYPIRTKERPLEREYEGIFSDGDFQKWGMGYIGRKQGISCRRSCAISRQGIQPDFHFFTNRILMSFHL
jgi:hypothetical protein